MWRAFYRPYRQCAKGDIHYVGTSSDTVAIVSYAVFLRSSKTIESRTLFKRIGTEIIMFFNKISKQEDCFPDLIPAT